MIPKLFQHGEGIPNRARPARAVTVSNASLMGLQPAQGGAYRESAGKFGQSTHDGLMQRGASLDYLRKGIDPMVMRVGGGGKAHKEKKAASKLEGERLC